MLWSYDGQVKRYVTQMMRLLSNFPVMDGRGNIKQVPVTYGNISRQVGHILKDNSENKLPSAPRISVYITDLQLDRNRLTDSTHTHKVNIRERKFDEETQSYTTEQGPGYTVERLIPTPYTLKCNADLWTSNTDQKLQLLEQMLVWFNPSLEIQTTDNFVDWTSITVVDLDNVNFSNNSIPVGVDSEIDVATMSFTIPIYISTPAKVKKMGVITNIITSIHDESRGNIEDGVTAPELNAYDDSLYSGASDEDGSRIARSSLSDNQVNVNYNQYSIFVSDGVAQLVERGRVGVRSWDEVIEVHPGEYVPWAARIFINNYDVDSIFVGTFSINDGDPRMIHIDWDVDSLPSDTPLMGKTGMDYIIDPTDYNPTSIKYPGLRILILEDLGSPDNTSGPTAWKNNNGSDPVAGANDILEWTGSEWITVFGSSEFVGDVVYSTNLNTGEQYKYFNGEWTLSVDGEYPIGTWRIDLQ